MERNAVTERFLKYSLERMQAGQMKKVNLRVTAIGEDGFDAVFSGRKRPVHVRMEDVLTAAYARGDQGALA